MRNFKITTVKEVLKGELIGQLVSDSYSVDETQIKPEVIRLNASVGKRYAGATYELVDFDFEEII